MFKTLLTILLSIILLQGAASAHEVLVVQSMAVKPYEEAVRGFVGTCKGTMKRIVLSAQQGSDLARIVREEPPRLIVVLGAEALAQVKKFKQIPVVYLMVLNPPVAAQEQQRITGVTMTIPPERYLTALKKALPDARRIGLLYDPKKSGPLVRRALQASR
ncbi:MAG TPA: ABC transporter substrate binding protein, partial [Geobacteraceae bacterium]